MRNTPRKLIKVLTPELIEQAREYVLSGNSLRSFAGKAGISMIVWETWIRENEELRYIKEAYNKYLIDRRKYNAEGKQVILDLTNKKL